MLGTNVPSRRRQAASVAWAALGSSLLPTIVRFMPTWTVTATPFTSISVFPFRYQPSDPVENSFGWAVILLPLMVTSTGLAPSVNCWRVIGQVVLAIGSPPEKLRVVGHLTGLGGQGKQVMSPYPPKRGRGGHDGRDFPWTTCPRGGMSCRVRTPAT